MTTNDPYCFGNLSLGEKLELFANSPLAHQLALSLPAQGKNGRPALTTTVGTLTVGLASVLAGSDRRADAELRHLWPILRPRLVEAGVPLPEAPITTQHFRDYRQRHLTAEVLTEFHAAFEDQAMGLAKALGLLEDHGEPLLAPSPTQLVFGDGAWFTPASDVGHLERRHRGKEKGKLEPHPSRSRFGCPRTCDYDTRGRAYGYNHVTLYVRGPLPRLRVVLALRPAPNGEELVGMEEMLARLVGAFGDGLRGFVYDGAMRGKHHQLYRHLGLLTVNLPKGMDSRTDWKKGLNKLVGKNAHIIAAQFPEGCTHYLNVAYGCFYELERTALGRWARIRVLQHVGGRRIPTGEGYRWELDVAIHCDHGEDHLWTIDPNGYLRSNKTGKGVYLAEQLRIITPNNGDQFKILYGVRNNAEAHNRLVRTDLGMGNRSRSYARKDHEIDRLLVCLFNNALAYAEHGHRRAS